MAGPPSPRLNVLRLSSSCHLPFHRDDLPPDLLCDLGRRFSCRGDGRPEADREGISAKMPPVEQPGELAVGWEDRISAVDTDGDDPHAGLYGQPRRP